MNSQSITILFWILMFMSAGFAAGFSFAMILAKKVITSKNDKN